jgi:benzoyl-CoA reductase/2-hydroxyglutaryl-CoA dehydratase subunit BcrC/BadD/HgdB
VSTQNESKALRELRDAAKSLMNPMLQEWKDSGKKIIGCLYHYIPEEIITAAGLLPYRMRATGSKGTELSELSFTQINCSFVRHLFDSGMRGELSFLDGVVAVNNCDHLRRFFENWQSKIKTPYMHFMNLPKKRGKEQAELYRKELAAFKDSLEKAFGVEITNAKLIKAIKLHNETRSLQRSLYNLRKKKNPPVSGADVHAVMVAAESVPKETYNSLLRGLLTELKDAEGICDYSERIMVVGGEIDDPEFIEVIESQGCLVVADSLGYGYRSCSEDVRTEGDPLTNLADYQVLERTACPRLFGTTFDRNASVKQIAEDFNADGVISVRLPLCDEWSFEQVNLIKYLKENNIPHLPMDIEYILSNTGQIKTRTQAFLETITSAKHA